MYFDFGNGIVVDYDSEPFSEDESREEKYRGLTYGAIVFFNGKKVAQVFEELGMILIEGYEKQKNEDLIFDFSWYYGNGEFYIKYVTARGICLYAGMYSIFIPFDDERQVYLWKERDLKFVDILNAKIYNNPVNDY